MSNLVFHGGGICYGNYDSSQSTKEAACSRERPSFLSSNKSTEKHKGKQYPNPRNTSDGGFRALFTWEDPGAISPSSQLQRALVLFKWLSDVWFFLGLFGNQNFISFLEALSMCFPKDVSKLTHLSWISDGDSKEKIISYPAIWCDMWWQRAFQAEIVVKNLPANAGDKEMWVQPLGWEDPLEEEMATHSSYLTWRIPWIEEPGGLQSVGSQRVRHNLAGQQQIPTVPFSLIHDFIHSISFNLISLSQQS